jgi:hypothetical protein
MLLFFPEQILNQSEELTTNITAKMENERDILAKLKGIFVFSDRKISKYIANIHGLTKDFQQS